MRTRAAVLAAALLVGCTGDEPAEEPRQGSRPLVPGVATVVLVAPPEEGAGDAPLFEWQEVEGAATYRLFVLNAEREPIWAWEGAATTVRLGGVTAEPPEGAAGPRVTPGSSWTVSALDAEGHVIALSSRRSISP